MTQTTTAADVEPRESRTPPNRRREHDEYGGFNIAAAWFGWLAAAGRALLVVVLVGAYFASGYVAGRRSRFDGARQALGVWLFAVLITIVLAALGAIAGATIPIDEGSLATGAAIALAAIPVGTLAGALLGGKTGERYHRKVDRLGYAT